MRRRRKPHRPSAAFRRHWERWGLLGPWVWAILGVVAALLVIRSVDSRLRPIVSEMASAQVHNTVNAVITDVVTETLATGQWTYEDMVTIQRDESGQITALQSNVSQSNLLRAEVVEAVLDEIAQLDVHTFSISIGNLFDFDIFSGRGPAIQVRTLTVGSIDARFDSIFSSAGINQTRHQIMLNITVPVTIFIASGSFKTDVETSICVAETVIVGAVPDTYLNISPTS